MLYEIWFFFNISYLVNSIERDSLNKVWRAAYSYTTRLYYEKFKFHNDCADSVIKRVPLFITLVTGQNFCSDDGHRLEECVILILVYLFLWEIVTQHSHFSTHEFWFNQSICQSLCVLSIISLTKTTSSYTSLFIIAPLLKFMCNTIFW